MSTSAPRFCLDAPGLSSGCSSSSGLQGGSRDQRPAAGQAEHWHERLLAQDGLLCSGETPAGETPPCIITLCTLLRTFVKKPPQEKKMSLINLEKVRCKKKKRTFPHLKQNIRHCLVKPLKLIHQSKQELLFCSHSCEFIFLKHAKTCTSRQLIQATLKKQLC